MNDMDNTLARRVRALRTKLARSDGRTLRLSLGIGAALLLVALLGYAAAGEEERLAAAQASFTGRAIENGAALYATNCAGCHGVAGRGIPEIAPALDSAAYFAERLAELSYPGDPRSYIEAAVAAGRPVPNEQYNSVMPTWAQAYGGPLRPDEVRDVASLVLNWHTAASPTDNSTPTPPPAGGPAALGKALYGSLDCLGCHGWPGRGGITGPDLAGLAARAGEQMPGLNAEAYVRVSVLAPSAFIVPDCPTGPCPDMMPRDYGARLSQREIELLGRYLLTLVEVPSAAPSPGAPPPLVGGLATPAPPPVAAADAFTRGKALYEAHCGMCHGDSGQGGMGTGLAAVLTSVDPWGYARAATAQGVPGMMPAWAQAYGGPLTDAELDDLASYIVDSRAAPVKN